MENIREIRQISIDELRAAVSAWRAHGTAPGLFRGPRISPTLYDRIDELVDEIERLRSIPYSDRNEAQ